ncbi:hypothetical protein [Acinetobacter modestus]|uniref:Lipoprotein n=1 Tax=Acinetobacter modestus TaxID=1776740 RepID=A0ABN0JKB0_9GAMM|nr:hypothetical protein [Acinetobacter modestus]ENU25602.1 hypothetical protein F992_03346 [Acinetobacter modestus]GGA24720.1 hypothetical protein GCM10017554_22250 [Acinetobacter modestus]
MFKKTFLAFACSTFLVACGGGGSTSTNNTDNGNPVAPVSDLNKAKQLIDTTNNIISYFDSFDGLQSQYQPTFDAISDAGTDTANASGLILTLASLAQQDAQNSTREYNAAQLEALLKEDSTYGEYYYPDYQLSNNTLKVSVTPNSVTVTGGVTAKYWTDYVWDYKTQTGHDVFGDEANVTVTNLKLEAPFSASQSTYDFKLVAGGKIATKNVVNKKEAILAVNSDSTAQVVYNNPAKLGDRSSDQVPKTAQFKFANVVLTAVGTGAELSLTEFSSKATQVQFKDGLSTSTEIIPTELNLKGKAIAGTESLNLEASIKLNNDLSKVIDITGGNESAAAFINADLNVKLSGNVKGGGTSIKPFSVNLTAKRNEYQKGTATIKITVDKDVLTADFKTDNLITTDVPVVWAKLSHPNGAYVEIADLDNFSLAQIKVGNTAYGTVSKVSDNIYSAKFTDNTVKAIAP